MLTSSLSLITKVIRNYKLLFVILFSSSMAGMALKYIHTILPPSNSSAVMMPDPCDVSLIEISLTNVTGLSQQPDYDDAHVCTSGDTLRYIMATPGLECNLGAVIAANYLKIHLPQGFKPGNYINLFGGIGGPFSLGTDYNWSELPTGGVNISFDPTQVKFNQTHPLTIDVVITPDCRVGAEIADPHGELGFTRPNSSVGIVHNY